MEGPTPVSASSTPRTMVTPGLLIARSKPIFDASPTAQSIVAGIGALTLVIGCIVRLALRTTSRGCGHGRTVSQIGYMFLGVAWAAVPTRCDHPTVGPRLFKPAMFPEPDRSCTQWTTRSTFRASVSVEVHEDHWDNVRHRLAGHHRTAAVSGFILQGPDHQRPRSRSRAGRVGRWVATRWPAPRCTAF